MRAMATEALSQQAGNVRFLSQHLNMSDFCLKFPCPRQASSSCRFRIYWSDRPAVFKIFHAKCPRNSGCRCPIPQALGYWASKDHPPGHLSSDRCRPSTRMVLGRRGAGPRCRGTRSVWAPGLGPVVTEGHPLPREIKHRGETVPSMYTPVATTKPPAGGVDGHDRIRRRGRRREPGCGGCRPQTDCAPADSAGIAACAHMLLLFAARAVRIRGGRYRRCRCRCCLRPCTTGSRRSPRSSRSCANRAIRCAIPTHPMTSNRLRRRRQKFGGVFADSAERLGVTGRVDALQDGR